MADPAETENQNILPVQALFNVDKSFNTFIGQGQPFIVSATESIGIQDVTALDATLYPTLSPVSTGQVTTLDVTSTKLTFNPSTGVLSATTFSGFLSGTASTANNFANGTSGQIPYQTSANNTSFITNGVLGQVLTSNGSGAPTWSNPTAAITLQDNTSTNATFYPLFANNTTGFVSTEFTSSTKYQFNPFTGVLTATGFAGAGTGLTGTASSLSIGGNAATATSATTATNLAGGANGSVPYQTGSGATTMLSAGSNGQILTLAAGVPTWAAAPSTGITITDDTTTNATRYLTFTSATAGSVTGENVSSTKLQYNPSTGTLTTTAFASASVAITGGSVNSTTVGATTASTGAFTTLSASSTVSGSGFSTYLASPPAIGGTAASTGRFTTVTSTVATGTAPFTVASTTAVANLSIGGNAGTVTNGVYTTDTGTVTNTMLAGSIANAKLANSSITFGSTAQALGSTVSAISGVTINNGAIGGTTAAAGTFTTLIGGNDVANYGQLTGGATTKAVEFKSLGSDTNVAYAIRSKGTGAIDLAAGSSGVNISNGGTVTALTRTNQGSNYTSPPTWAASAPTTAGGTTASGTVSIVSAPATIQSGGTGYTVGDVLSVVGGTLATGFPAAATYTVATVSSGVITAVTATNFAQYTTPPTNPVSVTGGTGSSATLNLTYGVGSVFTITNAGSGYVEQPTVTFSGGGGSGAAAYATVGSVTTIKSLGSSTTGATLASIQFVTPNTSSPNYPPLTIRDIANADTGILISPSTGYTQLIANAASSGILMLGSSGVSSVYFNTNGTSQTNQMRVSHTASAVNYVQVTGGATGSAPTISAQGSDANIGLSLTSKGTLPLYLQTASAIDVRIQPNGIRSLSVSSVASAVNYGVFTSAIAGFSPSLAVAGTDTNIDLTLTPKGTGSVKTASNAYVGSTLYIAP